MEFEISHLVISATDIRVATQGSGSVCALLSFEVSTVEVVRGILEQGEKPSKDLKPGWTLRKIIGDRRT